MRYLTLGAVPWQSDVCLPHTNAANPLPNGCGSASNHTKQCLIITICCFCSSEKCQCFVGLHWSEECEAFFQKQGAAAVGFFPFPELGGWRTAWQKRLLSLLAIHCVHLVCQKRSAAAANAEQRLIAGCCSTRHG